MIQGSKTTQRALEARDIETLRQWRNHPELFGLHFSPLPASDIEQRRWYENYANSGTHVFIVVNEEKRPIGYTILKDVDHKNAHAEIGIHLAPEAQGKGYGRDAFAGLISFCFEELNLQRVWLRVFDFNQRAIALYAKMGFAHEGRLRSAYFTQGHYVDIVVMGLLREEWKPASS